MRYNCLYILMFILSVVWALVFIERHKQQNNKYGGAFDIHKFIAGLRKKYTSPHDHIEIELKLKNKGVYDRLASYVRNDPNHTKENTLNHIWHGENKINIIKTIDNKSIKKWSTKKRLSKYDTELGVITISLEHILHEQPANISGEPTLVRKKNRISAKINKHWRIDCTQVQQELENINSIQNEVEIEYIAPDYWNALKHIDEIDEFLATLN